MDFLSGKQKARVFPLDADGNHLYSPWGKFGATYYVPDDPIRKKIEIAEFIWAISWMMSGTVGTLIGTVTGHTFDDFVVAIWVLPIIIIGTVCQWSIDKQTRCLQTATARPSFWPTFREVSKATNPIKIWSAQIVCLGLVTVSYFALFVWHHHRHRGWIGYVDPALLTLLAVSVATVCGLMLVIRDT